MSGVRVFFSTTIGLLLSWALLFSFFNTLTAINRSRRNGLLSLYRECGRDMGTMIYVLIRSHQ